VPLYIAPWATDPPHFQNKSVESLHFESLKDEKRGMLSDADFHVHITFDPTINSSPEPNVDETAKHFFTDLVAVTPESQSSIDAESYEYMAELDINCKSYHPSALQTRRFCQGNWHAGRRR
jgi:hypothetical protein